MYRIVDDDCYPYESGTTGNTGNCLVSKKVKSLSEISQCRSSNSLTGRTELYRSQHPYKINSKENDIKYEIMTFGPVQGIVPYLQYIHIVTYVIQLFKRITFNTKGINIVNI